jgi:hypothetical protein
MFIELLSEITGVNALVQHDYTVVLPRLPASQCGCMLCPEAMLRLRLRCAGHMCATDRIQF